MNPYTRVKIPLFTHALGYEERHLHAAKLCCNPTLQECVIIGAFSHMPLGFRKIEDEKLNILPLRDQFNDAIYYNNMIYVVTCHPFANYLTIWRYLGKEEKEWRIPHVPHLPPKKRCMLVSIINIKYFVLCGVPLPWRMHDKLQCHCLLCYEIG